MSLTIIMIRSIRLPDSGVRSHRSVYSAVQLLQEVKLKAFAYAVSHCHRAVHFLCRSDSVNKPQSSRPAPLQGGVVLARDILTEHVGLIHTLTASN